MSNDSVQPNTPDEEALFAFADRPDAAPSTDLEITLRRVQQATNASTIPSDLKHDIWENLMHSTATTFNHPGATTPGLAPGNVPRTRRGTPARDATRRFPLHTAANILLAAAVILALAVGIWRATDGFGPGGGNDDGQPTMQFGGPGATPASDIDPADLPTAEECTVEPLTVDDVIGYILAPYTASVEKNTGTPIAASQPATPDPTEVAQDTEAGAETSGTPATQEDLDAAAATQRMWMACVLADSYYQVWALEDPNWVREQVMTVLPPLTGEAEARSILEDLRDNGPVDVWEGPGLFYSYSSRGYPGLGGIHVIDTDPAHSWMLSPELMVTGYLRYSPEGEYLGRSTAISGTDSEQFRNLAPGTCSTFMFAWNEDRQAWLVRGAPNCG